MYSLASGCTTDVIQESLIVGLAGSAALAPHETHPNEGHWEETSKTALLWISTQEIPTHLFDHFEVNKATLPSPTVQFSTIITSPHNYTNSHPSS